MNDSDKVGLTSVLDQLDDLTDEDQVSIGQIVDKLGASSFASLMLIFALIAVSPASAIPGVTASVGLIVAILVIQMMAGKKSAWLPAFLLRRNLSAQKLKTGIAWLRKPVGWIERILRQRLTAVLHRPVSAAPARAASATDVGSVPGAVHADYGTGANVRLRRIHSHRHFRGGPSGARWRAGDLIDDVDDCCSAGHMAVRVCGLMLRPTEARAY